VMLDGTGSLSFDVLSWLSAQRIPLVQINWQGEVITVLGGTPLAADARPLVEAQRAAANGETGLALSVALVREKIRGCKTTLESLPESLPRGRALGRLDIALGELTAPVASLETLRLIEGRAALAYFGFWQTLPLSWKGTRQKTIPEERRRIGIRQSTLSGGKTGDHGQKGCRD
jgi:CRISPR-associated protein Cas1